MAARAVATRRVLRDLQDLEKDPIPGVSVTPVSDDIFHLHLNVTIPEGPYEGIVIHMALHIPDTYPLSAPAGRIAPNFPYTSQEHSHIHGQELCNDQLSNYSGYFAAIDGGTIQAGAGWRSGCSLRGLCIMLSSFFVETDLSPPTQDSVSQLRARILRFVCPECPSTGLVVYPPIPQAEIAGQLETPNILTRARENLMCQVSRENFVDNTVTLGYPIKLVTDHRGRLQITLYPDMISYDIYMTDLQRVGFSRGGMSRTPSGQPYNRWLPIYISEEHFQKNLICIKHTVSVLAKGDSGVAENDFVPEHILTVFPCLLNKMILAMTEGTLHESESAILAYSHYHRLFTRLLEMYPELSQRITEDVRWFIADRKRRNKKCTPDIGEFIVKLSVCKDYKWNDPNVLKFVIEEYFARQVYWVTQKVPLTELHRLDPPRRLFETFKFTGVSNKILAFNICITDLMRETSVQDLDAMLNVPTEAFVQIVQQKIKAIKGIQKYEDLVNMIRLNGVIRTRESMISLLDTAERESFLQGYTRPPVFQNSQSSGTSQATRGGSTRGSRGRGQSNNERRF